MFEETPTGPRRPSRQPPAPPLPPKDSSPAVSNLSLNYYSGLYNYNMAQSERAYSEVQSVHSMVYSTRSLQSPMMLCYKCNSAQSESEYFSAQSECYTSCCKSRYTCGVSRCCSVASPQQNICSTVCCSDQTSGQTTTCRNGRTAVHQKPVRTPPVPHRGRNVQRPRLSISPMPECTNKKGQSKYHYGCEPASYRLSIEQHIESLFKYLNDRQKRLEGCIAMIQANINEPQSERTIRQLLVNKETRYLRSLRTRLGPKNFQVIQMLGSGHMGTVLLVEKVDPYYMGEDKELYAMKKLKKSQVFQQKHMAHVMAERDILAEADNEWIVKLYQSFQDEKYLYFILEYIPGGDMMSLLMRQIVFPEEWAQFYIAEISLALQFVHDMNFIHRDIKPDNILIDRDGHIKLTDFGLCTGFRWTHDLKFYRDDTVSSGQDNPQDDHPTITRALTQREIDYSSRKSARSLVGSPNYIAPEVLRQDSENERLCDWWSVGVILYEMVVGYCPFIDIEKVKLNQYTAACETAYEIQYRIQNWKRYLAFPSPDDPNSPPQTTIHPGSEPQYMSPATKSLIQGWLCDPENRLCRNGIDDIRNHPFFRCIDWENIRSKKAPYIPELRDAKDTRHFDPPNYDYDATLGGSNSRILKTMTDFTYRKFPEL